MTRTYGQPLLEPVEKLPIGQLDDLVDAQNEELRAYDQALVALAHGELLADPMRKLSPVRVGILLHLAVTINATIQCGTTAQLVHEVFLASRDDRPICWPPSRQPK